MKITEFPFLCVDDFKFNMALEDSASVLELLDAKGEKGNSKYKLIVRQKSTHAARETLNGTMYLPADVRNAVDSWTADYNKPFLKNHDTSGEPLGRIQEAYYVDVSDEVGQLTPDEKAIINNATKMTPDLAVVIDRISEIQKIDPGWSGLGYDMIVAQIDDVDAVTKFKDKRYNTGSSGKMATGMYCNICYKDWAKDGRCDHETGETYNMDKKGKVKRKCVYVPFGIDNVEYSIVNVPADTQSSTEAVEEIPISDGATVELFAYDEDSKDLRSGDCKINLMDSFDSFNTAMSDFIAASVIAPKEKQEDTKGKEEKDEDTKKEKISISKEHEDAFSNTEVKRKHYLSASSEDHLHRCMVDPASGNGYTEYVLNHSHDVVNMKIKESTTVYDWSVTNEDGSHPELLASHTHKMGEETEKLEWDSVDIVDNYFYTKQYSPFLSFAKENLWPDEYKDVLLYRAKEIMSEDKDTNLDDEHVTTLIKEVLNEMITDTLTHLTYDETILPILKGMREDLSADKAFNGAVLDDADAKLVDKGIKSSILSKTARQRMHTSYYVSPARVFPCTDRFHALAIRSFVDNSDLPLPVKEFLYGNLGVKEKSLGLGDAVSIEEGKVIYKTYEDLYNNLKEGECSLIDSHISSSINETKLNLEKEFETKLTAETDALLSLTSKYEALGTNVDELNNNNVRIKDENRVLTSKIGTLKQKLVDVIVENIMDLTIVDKESNFDKDAFEQGLMSKPESILYEELVSLRDKVRTDYTGNNDTNDDNNEDNTNAYKQTFDQLPAEDKKFFNSLFADLKKKSNK